MVCIQSVWVVEEIIVVSLRFEVRFFSLQVRTVSRYQLELLREAVHDVSLGNLFPHYA